MCQISEFMAMTVDLSHFVMVLSLAWVCMLGGATWCESYTITSVFSYLAVAANVCFVRNYYEGYKSDLILLILINHFHKIN